MRAYGPIGPMPKHHDFLFLAEIGRRLTAKRQDMEFSQQDVADASNISPQMLSRYEQGMADPPLSTIVRICQALQLSPTALLIQSMIMAEPAIKRRSRSRHGTICRRRESRGYWS